MAGDRDPKWGQGADALKASADLAQCQIPVSDPVTLPSAPTPMGKLRDAARAMKRAVDKAPPVASCQQSLWLSFFFDGTGNNLDADVGTQEHSNVARLFRAMPLDRPVAGLFSHYIPGIGTYFKEIGDPGGTVRGRAFAAKGRERLDWALQRFDERVRAAEARALNPTNKIVMIHVAVFGFSRGAALARAFVRDLAARCEPAGAGWRLRANKAPLSIRFVGLWDTVASVGVPTGALGTMGLRPDPVEIAFGRPGADPAGLSLLDGHGDWGGDLRIPPMVERCVHHVAAHEVRNSFPLDSVTRDGVKPTNCVEIVYPGVHSNVGGGYRPGEGGRSVSEDLMLSQISLKAMYDDALAHGVPLLTESSMEWQRYNSSDLDVAAALRDSFKHYMRNVGPLPLGEAFNAHNRLYYAWRFRHIRTKASVHAKRLGRGHELTTEERAIASSEYQAKLDQQKLQAEIEAIEREDGAAIAAARRRVEQAQARLISYRQASYADPDARQGDAARVAEVKVAEDELANTQDRLRKAKARQDTLPSRGELIGALKHYDQRLLDAAENIQDRIRRFPSMRQWLRPHYKALLEAYENEFVHGRGLTDPKLIDFFEHYVHDSLAAFDTDGTDPSDPRVIYVGGDVKLRFAAREPVNESLDQTMTA